MALAGYPLKCESPKITHTAFTSDLTVTNPEGIDMIKITGSNVATTTLNSHAHFQVWMAGEDTSSSGHVIEASAGDVIEGPFVKVFYDASLSQGSNLDVFVYERSKTTAS